MQGSALLFELANRVAIFEAVDEFAEELFGEDLRIVHCIVYRGMHSIAPRMAFGIEHCLGIVPRIASRIAGHCIRIASRIALRIVHCIKNCIVQATVHDIVYYTLPKR